jgi:hypothetical protein
LRWAITHSDVAEFDTFSVKSGTENTDKELLHPGTMPPALHQDCLLSVTTLPDIKNCGKCKSYVKHKFKACIQELGICSNSI